MDTTLSQTLEELAFECRETPEIFTSSTFRDLQAASEALGGTSLSSGTLLMATCLAGGDTELATVATESFALTNDSLALLGATESVLDTIKDKLQAAVHSISGAILKPLNLLMKLGDQLNKIAATAVNAPLRAVTGVELDKETVGWIVSGTAAAAAIATAFFAKVPLSSLTAEAKAASAVGVKTPEWAGLVTKISEFKWPFGNFTGVFTQAGKRIRVNYKVTKRAAEAMWKTKGGAELAKEGASGLFTAGKEVARTILDTCRKLIIDGPKAMAQAAGSVINGPIKVVTDRLAASGAAAWKITGVRAIGYSLWAVVVGFVGKVFATAAHALTAAIHRVTEAA